MNLRWNWIGVAAGLGFLGLVLLLSGCSGGSTSSSSNRTDTAGASSQAPSSHPRIALIMKSLANEFFLTMENGARKHQQAHAQEYELIANGIKDELDVARQIDLVEQM